MKLVELLAKELVEWPDGCKTITQDDDGDVGSYRIHDPVTASARPSDAVWTAKGHIENLPRLSDIATDHATAIVTREMWEAERSRSDSGAFLDAVMSLPGDTDPRHNRDRIREIDKQLADLAVERAERGAELAAEGFSLIAVSADPVEDMSDWRNWKAGDLVDVIGDGLDDALQGQILRVDFIEQPEGQDQPVKLKAISGGYHWPQISAGNFNLLRWHSRPSA
jgi:hypothetical protein